MCSRHLLVRAWTDRGYFHVNLRSNKHFVIKLSARGFHLDAELTRQGRERCQWPWFQNVLVVGGVRERYAGGGAGRRGENGVEGTGERKGGDRRCLRVLMHAAENTFYKRTRFMREHVLQENMFYKRTHSIKEHILSENTFYKRTCSK